MQLTIFKFKIKKCLFSRSNFKNKFYKYFKKFNSILQSIKKDEKDGEMNKFWNKSKRKRREDSSKIKRTLDFPKQISAMRFFPCTMSTKLTGKSHYCCCLQILIQNIRGKLLLQQRLCACCVCVCILIGRKFLLSFFTF